MSLLNKANLIIYRVRDKGLEVFLVKPKEQNEASEWSIPQGALKDQAKTLALVQQDQAIELDPVDNLEGEKEGAIAVEGDWHDIPSLKCLMKDDAIFVKDTLQQMIPDMESQGSYFAIKEAFKKVLPNQYEFLKELKDIIKERNSTKYL